MYLAVPIALIKGAIFVGQVSLVVVNYITLAVLILYNVLECYYLLLEQISDLRVRMGLSAVWVEYMVILDYPR